MAKSRKYRAVAPNGEVFERGSTSFDFGYCVVYKDCYEQELGWANEGRASDLSNYAYYYGMAYEGGYNSRGNRGQASMWLKCRGEEERLDAVKRIEGCADAKAYQAKLVALRVAGVEMKKDVGGYERYRLAGWCSRLDLAQKQAAGRYKAEILVADRVA